MIMELLPAAARDLETAEEFLDFFGLPYDRKVVSRCRLHILQRFHDYIAHIEPTPADEQQNMTLARDALARAYDDFIRSDPLTERVFKVLKDAKKQPDLGGRAFVPLSAIGGLKRTQE